MKSSAKLLPGSAIPSGAVRPSYGPAVLLIMLLGGAVSLMMFRWIAFLPADRWLKALLDPDRATIDEVILLHAIMPRAAMALLCGMALGMSGAIFQIVLNNPLAEPTTLGVSAGATLATVLSLTFLPAMAIRPELMAGIGAFSALAVVIGLSLAFRFSPSVLILAGLLVNLYCASLASIAILFNHELLDSIFLWQAGSLRQDNWTGAVHLGPAILVCGGLLALTARQLSFLQLGDDNARSLGISPVVVRIFALVLGTTLAALTVAYVGMIGFVGLAAPALARMAGVRRIGARLVWAASIGGALLLLADELVQLPGSARGELPTGAFTALIGAPLLLVMIARRRSQGLASPSSHLASGRRRNPARPLVLLAVACLIVALAALMVGRSGTNWGVTLDPDILFWRWPRILAALCGGALLGAAGTVLQRMTGNPLAGPEILGISSAAALGMALQLILSLQPSVGVGGSAIGATIGLVAVMIWSRRHPDSPQKLLLVGVALNLTFGAVLGLLMATGHPRLKGVIAWLSGSTANVTPDYALWCAASLIPIGLALVALSRWLTILPLGSAAARGLGLPLRTVNSMMLVLAAVATGISTTLLGPTTFIGLLAPTVIRLIGIRPALHQAWGAMLAGGLLAMLADWIGRTILFPWEIPAGLVVSFLAVPTLFLLLIRRRH